ncbi:hypothetical protein IHE55_02660 [Streptomyces pactum]|uniref:Uncharacterized protein n=1 Tax=Streptomyces pactum TaxID=68249 RepID=A0ABS0NF05_9ACTN|nr:hypothetical protein [Streptomyces pactum]
MAPSDNGGRRHHRRGHGTRRALRREAPSTVALLADEADFAAMRRYTSFGFDDHRSYLRQAEGLLQDLAARELHTTVALFDPAEYAEYCADAGLDPDSPGSRTRYVAEVAAAGGTVPYTGQPVRDLLPELLRAVTRRATADTATGLLLRAGDCPDCGEDLGEAALRRAGLLLTRLLEAAGPGDHHLVCSVATRRGSLTAALSATVPAGADGSAGPPLAGEEEALVFGTVLAAGIATGGPAGLVMRTSPDGRPDALRGWALDDDGWLRPLSEAEVFAAYCTDVFTGEPVPPEHGVEYRGGFPLPRPEQEE